MKLKDVKTADMFDDLLKASMDVITFREGTDSYKRAENVIRTIDVLRTQEVINEQFRKGC